MTRLDDAAPLVLGFPDYEQPSRRLASRAGFDYAGIDIHEFPDGESLLRLPPRLPRHVILCRSLNDANRKLIELELAAATALELGAKRLTLVAPYLCYMRQDRAFHPGESVSQRVVGKFLARHFDELITVDPHLHRTHRLQTAVPVRRAIALSAAPAMADWLASRGEKPLLIGPDAESEQWVSAIAAPSKLEYGVARKRRLGDRNVRVELPELDFRSRHVVLVDDVASTGQTLAEAARQLKQHGAKSISVLVTHALFVDDALDRLRLAGVDGIHSTDSIPHASNTLHLADILAVSITEDADH
jgi:ribose-phosphate pyrophosphokinase